MMMMKSVFWWRKPEYPEETTDLSPTYGKRRVTTMQRTLHGPMGMATFNGYTSLLAQHDLNGLIGNYRSKRHRRSHRLSVSKATAVVYQYELTKNAGSGSQPPGKIFTVKVHFQACSIGVCLRLYV